MATERGYQRPVGIQMGHGRPCYACRLRGMARYCGRWATAHKKRRKVCGVLSVNVTKHDKYNILSLGMKCQDSWYLVTPKCHDSWIWHYFLFFSRTLTYISSFIVRWMKMSGFVIFCHTQISRLFLTFCFFFLLGMALNRPNFRPTLWHHVYDFFCIPRPMGFAHRRVSFTSINTKKTVFDLEGYRAFQARDQKQMLLFIERSTRWIY